MAEAEREGVMEDIDKAAFERALLAACRMGLVHADYPYMDEVDEDMENEAVNAGVAAFYGPHSETDA